MRKLILIGSLAIFAAALCGCGGGADGGSGGTGPAPKIDDSGSPTGGEKVGSSVGDAGKPEEVKINPDGKL